MGSGTIACVNLLGDDGGMCSTPTGMRKSTVGSPCRRAVASTTVCFQRFFAVETSCSISCFLLHAVFGRLWREARSHELKFQRPTYNTHRFDNGPEVHLLAPYPEGDLPDYGWFASVTPALS